MKNILSKISAFSILMLLAGNVSAQCTITPNCYVSGDYVEVAVAATGAYGCTSAPAGFHPNVGSSLGFVSDPDKDGWLVSSPGSAVYMGDYFVPGSPYEGWDFKANGTTTRFRNDASGGTCASCAHISYTATATEQTTEEFEL